MTDQHGMIGDIAPVSRSDERLTWLAQRPFVRSPWVDDHRHWQAMSKQIQRSDPIRQTHGAALRGLKPGLRGLPGNLQVPLPAIGDV